MKYFWFKFGRADARSLAEACRATVSFLLPCFPLGPSHFFKCLLFMFLLLQDLQKAGAQHSAKEVHTSNTGETMSQKSPAIASDTQKLREAASAPTVLDV